MAPLEIEQHILAAKIAGYDVHYLDTKGCFVHSDTITPWTPKINCEDNFKLQCAIQKYAREFPKPWWEQPENVQDAWSEADESFKTGDVRVVMEKMFNLAVELGREL